MQGHILDIKHAFEITIVHLTNPAENYKTKEEKTLFEKYQQQKLNRNYDPGDTIWGIFNSCYDCGLEVDVILTDEKTLTIVDRYGRSSHNNREIDFFNKPCEAISLREAQKLISIIDVPTGEIVFQNYFMMDDNPKDTRSTRKYNLCHIYGRQNIMTYLATLNVGYGQMGNMGMGIYASEDTILIGKAEDSLEESYYYYLELTDEELSEDSLKDKNDCVAFSNLIKKSKSEFKGELSLSVWRWMCADKSVVKALGEEIKDTAVIFKVKPGKYQIEHYYDFPKNGDYFFSQLKRIENGG